VIWRVVSRTIAELVFKEENFAMGSAKQDMDGSRSLMFIDYITFDEYE